jgi:pilus assembly protein Flp/PilA
MVTTRLSPGRETRTAICGGLSMHPTALIALFADRQGATAIEYALIASLISIGILSAITTASSGLAAIFNSVSAGL